MNITRTVWLALALFNLPIIAGWLYALTLPETAGPATIACMALNVLLTLYCTGEAIAAKSRRY